MSQTGLADLQALLNEIPSDSTSSQKNKDASTSIKLLPKTKTKTIQPPIEEKPSLEFSRKARAVNYKPKSLSEFRAQQELLQPQNGQQDGWQTLGSLGADLESEELKNKRAQRERMQQYAASLRKENKLLQGDAPRKLPPSVEAKKTREKAIKAKSSARDRAKQFAKSIAPPKARTTRQSTPSTNMNTRRSNELDHNLAEEIALRLAKHDDYRQQVQNFSIMSD